MYVCMYVADFLHTKSEEVNYVTIHFLPDWKFNTISKKLKMVIKKYLTRGFTIIDVFGDNEF